MELGARGSGNGPSGVVGGLFPLISLSRDPRITARSPRPSKKGQRCGGEGSPGWPPLDTRIDGSAAQGPPRAPSASSHSSPLLLSPFFSPPAFSPLNFLSLTTQGLPGCQFLLVGVSIGTISLEGNLSNAIKNLKNNAKALTWKVPF